MTKNEKEAQIRLVINPPKQDPLDYAEYQIEGGLIRSVQLINNKGETILNYKVGPTPTSRCFSFGPAYSRNE